MIKIFRRKKKSSPCGVCFPETIIPGWGYQAICQKHYFDSTIQTRNRKNISGKLGEH